MPSKKKKAKTFHDNHLHTNQKHRNTKFSQAEIWDDSVLVRSWEDAVEEYEYYHSLAARGIDPEEVLDQAEEAEGRGEEVDLKLDEEVRGSPSKRSVFVNGGADGAALDVDGGSEDGEIEEGEAEDGGVAGKEGQGLTNGVSPMHQDHGKEHGPPLPLDFGTEQVQPQPGSATSAKGATAAAMGADQTLENVKMAYYWAGYYSGLYDGQRQATGVDVGGGNNRVLGNLAEEPSSRRMSRKE